MTVTPQLPAGQGPYLGFMDPTSSQGMFNQIAFIAKQLDGKIGTMLPVQVVGTTSSGLVAPPGALTVVPQVNQIDGQGNPTPHGKIYNIPFQRVANGDSAIIMDPEVGDLGMAFVAMRDISKFKSTKAQANPGSFRRYNLSDSIYLGSIFSGTPTQFIQFLLGAMGINITSPQTITLTAPTVAIVGKLTVTGTIVSQSEVTGNGIPLSTHKHTGVTTGGGDTGGPTT
jgi:hypothetical protein